MKILLNIQFNQHDKYRIILIACFGQIRIRDPTNNVLLNFVLKVAS
jgi:hypothetical protein